VLARELGLARGLSLRRVRALAAGELLGALGLRLGLTLVRDAGPAILFGGQFAGPGAGRMAGGARDRRKQGGEGMPRMSSFTVVLLSDG
jgi:hypothetical protein